MTDGRIEHVKVYPFAMNAADIRLLWEFESGELRRQVDDYNNLLKRHKP